jgi:phage terminase large subunit-like protein
MASPYYFDKTLARHAVEFFPRFLRLVDNEWAGRRFELNKEQAYHVGQIFGWRRRDGTRRYRRVRWWEPKRNGKTELFAGIGHILTVGDAEPTAEVFSYATDKAQAQICWDKARRMVTAEIDPTTGKRGPLAKLYELSGTSLFCPHLLSSFKFLSGDPEGKHGRSVHGALGDEAWEWRNGLLHRHLQKSMGSRRQPLDATFSSAGVIRTYGHELFEESAAIRDDPSRDPECYVVIYGGSRDDDWTSPDNWAKWNPNYPISPKHDFLMSLCQEAQRRPRLENEFKQFHCGIWTEQTTRWFGMHHWPDNTSTPGDSDRWKRLAEEMTGRPAWGGIDLASTDDMTAVVWVFPPEKPGERWTLIPRFWVPAAIVPDRDKPSSPYRKWIGQKALAETDGNVTDYDFIEAEVYRDAERFKVKKADPKDPTQFDVAIDRYDATQFTTHLMGQGFKVSRHGQGWVSMSAPSKELERLFNSGQLEHGNHPVLHWMFGNAAYRRGPHGTIAPDKLAAAQKIDGVVAAIMGLNIAQARKPGPPDLSKLISSDREMF